METLGRCESAKQAQSNKEEDWKFGFTLQRSWHILEELSLIVRKRERKKRRKRKKKGRKKEGEREEEGGREGGMRERKRKKERKSSKFRSLVSFSLLINPAKLSALLRLVLKLGVSLLSIRARFLSAFYCGFSILYKNSHICHLWTRYHVPGTSTHLL